MRRIDADKCKNPRKSVVSAKSAVYNNLPHKNTHI